MFHLRNVSESGWTTLTINSVTPRRTQNTIYIGRAEHFTSLCTLVRPLISATIIPTMPPLKVAAREKNFLLEVMSWYHESGYLVSKGQDKLAPKYTKHIQTLDWDVLRCLKLILTRLGTNHHRAVWHSLCHRDRGTGAGLHWELWEAPRHSFTPVGTNTTTKY